MPDIAADIQAAAAEVGASAQAAAERVTATVGDLRAQLADAQTKLEEALAAAPDNEALQGALDAVRNADLLVDSIEPAETPGTDEEPHPDQTLPGDLA